MQSYPESSMNCSKSVTCLLAGLAGPAGENLALCQGAVLCRYAETLCENCFPTGPPTILITTYPGDKIM